MNIVDLTERQLLNILIDRRNYAQTIGLDVALMDVLDGLSLILCEDSETGLYQFLKERENYFCNIKSFLNAYERASVEHSKLLTKLPNK